MNAGHEPEEPPHGSPRKLVVLEPRQLAALRRLAAAQGHGNVSAVIRAAVDDYVARHGDAQPTLWSRP